VQGLENVGSSDHKLIFCNLDTDDGRPIVKNIKTRFDYNYMDIQGLRDKLKLVYWMPVLIGSAEEC